MLEKISDSLYFIQGRRYDSNSILVISDISFVVDTGTGMLFSELANELARCGHPPNKIDAIVNTHCHFDHVGGNHYFDCPVHIHEQDLQHLAQGDEYTAANMFDMQLTPTKPLALEKEFHGWEIIHTPGHSQGSICLYKKPYLISGDTLFADGIGRTDLPGGNGEQMQKSLDLLTKLDYGWILPGHGPMAQKHEVTVGSDVI